MIAKENWKRTWIAYVASFRMGIHMCLTEKLDFIIVLLTYGTLLAIFTTICRIMPLHELNHPDLTWQNMIWYFAITEAVVISMQGNQRKFGHMIAASEISLLMQRPGSMLGILVARLFGNSWMHNLILLCFAMVVLPLFGEAYFTMPFWMLPILIISMMMGIMIYLMLGHMVGMLELFGAYSSPVSLILSKFVFTFGGLFFPVIFFPPTLQTISSLTPFPAIISVPGHMMLNPTGASIIYGLLQQLFWLVTMTILAVFAERRLVRYVLTHGD